MVFTCLWSYSQIQGLYYALLIGILLLGMVEPLRIRLRDLVLRVIGLGNDLPWMQS